MSTARPNRSQLAIAEPADTCCFRFRHRKAVLVRAAIAMFAFWSAILPASGTLMVPLSIPELVAESDLITHAKVVSINTRRNSNKRIITRVGVEIIEIWKGRHSGSRLEVLLAGGTLGTEQVIVAGQPDYRPGEEVVLFLKFNDRKEAVTVGLAQGKFAVWTNPATGQKEAHNPFHGRARTTEVSSDGPTSQAPSAQDSMLLTDLKRMVIENSP